MTVGRIINEKGRDIVAVAPEVSLAEAAAVLSQKGIGAVVVMEEGRLRGILSERDIVRALAKHGSEAMRKLANDCMTSKVVTCRMQDTIEDVMQKMTSGRFRHLPVMDDAGMVGIISIGDVVKRRLQEMQQEADQIREYIATA